MGIAADRKRRFYVEHPVCCFCGGTVPATTQDHIPSRSFFRQRQWPVGYVFPACEPCNKYTATDETLTSLVCRMASNDGDDPASMREIELLMKEVARNNPDLYRSFLARPTRVRQWLRERDLELPPGMSTRDVPIISLQHPDLIESIQRYATKLFLSLYYLHTRTVLPDAGGIVFLWYSNATPADRRPPVNMLAPIWQGFPELTRQNTSLGDQFRYGFAIAGADIPAAVFLAEFNTGIAMLGFAFPDISRIQVPERAVVLRPFSPS